MVIQDGLVDVIHYVLSSSKLSLNELTTQIKRNLLASMRKFDFFSLVDNYHE